MGVIDGVVDALLVLAVLVQLLCVAGVVAAANVFARLHFVAPALLGLLAIALAIALREGASQLSVKAALVWLIVLVSGPVVAHASARAARIRQFGAWSILESERAEGR